MHTTRRRFIGTTVTLCAGLSTGTYSLIGAPAIIRNYNKPDSFINGVQIGVITYSFRSMKDQDAESVLKYVKESGINAIELMGDPAEYFAGKPKNPVDRRAYFRLMRKSRNGTSLTMDEEKEKEDMQKQMEDYNKTVASWRSSVPMDAFSSIRTVYHDAGVRIYGFKPSAFGLKNSDAEIDYGFRAAKSLGATHVTLEHPSDNDHTMKLGKFATKHKIHVAYHGHEQQTPTLWDTALNQSRFNALNLDLGHYIAAGNPDPAILIKSKHDRISSMHLKDRTTPDNGKSNLPWGTGDTPITRVLRMMRDEKYKFPGTIELEYQIPEDSNAVSEVSKCLEYCKQALADQ